MAIVQMVWNSHRGWSRLADTVRGRLDRWRLVNLVLLALGALSGALATGISWPAAPARTACAVSAAVLLALAGVIQQRFLGRDRVLRWTTARAASEALKAETFRYLAGVRPYAGIRRDVEMTRQLAEIQHRSADFIVDFAQMAPDGRPLPEVHDLAGYVAVRAQEQQGWHQQRVTRHTTRAKWLRGAELAATLGAAGLAAAAGTPGLPDLSAWVGVATTLGAAIAAHLAATQHDRIAASYARTADQLRRLISGIDPEDATPEQGARFVRDVERVLAVQNDGWVSLLST